MDYVSIIRHLCDVFNKNSVEYMIVGGTAVALHGYYRQSKSPKGELVDKPDLDIWYNPSPENYFRLLNALEQLGKDMTVHRNATVIDPRKSFLRFELEDFTLDLLPSIKAPLRFWPSFAKRQVFSSQGNDISFISLEDLIQDKETSPRPKDLDDIEHLKRL